MPVRRYKVADVSAEAKRGWRNFTRAHRLRSTSLAEALGLWMADHDETPLHQLPPVWRTLIEAAGDIQAENSARGTDELD